MTKNGRRGLFLLVATVGNMLLTVILIFAMLALWAVVSNWLGIQESTMAPAVIVAFIGGIVLSGFIYSRVLKALQKRPDLEQRFGLLKK
jgi:uncharacterized integral membrane protein